MTQTTDHPSPAATPPRPASTATTAALLLRLVFGALFTAHGAQKIFEWTIAGTAQAFGQMGIPLAELTAPVVAALEFGGGIALVLGLLTRPIAALLAVDMLGALALVHLGAGLFVADGGYELVLALAGGAAALALTGGGRLSLDHLLFARRRTASPTA
ncbi:DoxX family protein [Arthrobacter sp.]|uniref:DoxX family protein n=1 Tax=Arthrobacter sp. TaxID=1667 RepID=UPI003A9044C8